MSGVRQVAAIQIDVMDARLSDIINGCCVTPVERDKAHDFRPCRAAC